MHTGGDFLFLSYNAVRGVEMDEYIVDYLSRLKDAEGADFKALLKSEVKKSYQGDSNEKEIRVLDKEIEKLERSIRAQVKALRTATAATRPYIQADLDDIASEIAQKKQEKSMLESVKSDAEAQTREVEKMVELIEGFDAIRERDDPAELQTAVKTIVERVYVRADGEKKTAEIFIKGAQREKYGSDFFDRGVDADGGVDAMCDLDRDSELHPYLCRDSAETRMR